MNDEAFLDTNTLVYFAAADANRAERVEALLLAGGVVSVQVLNEFASVALRKLDMPRERQANLCAVVGIVAFVDVPLVFLSARLWRSIHPAVFANKGGGLEPEMKVAAIAAVLCFGLIWAALVGLRTLQIKQKERLDGLAVHGEL